MVLTRRLVFTCLYSLMLALSEPAPVSVLAGDIYGTFTTVGEMKIPRSYHTATLLPNGKVLIAGGRRSFRDELDSAELYDPALHKFIPTGKLISARAGHTATLLLDGKVLITGGFQTGTALCSAELYDPVSGTFKPTGNMREPRQRHTATLLPNGRVLIAGGGLYDTGLTPFPENTGVTAAAELYDPATGKFLATGAMTVARMLHYATALNDGHVLIVGGVTGGGTDIFFSGANYLPNAELYEPGPARFRSLPTNDAGQYPGSYGSAVLLANGRVLIAGGVEHEVIVSNARLYDPTERQFLRTGSMASERINHVATLLSNGQVLVTGGIRATQRQRTTPWPDLKVVATAELYDPEPGVFVGLPDMTTSRVGHTATLLPDGEVLIAGGTHGNFVGLSAVELYQPASIVKGALLPKAGQSGGKLQSLEPIISR